MAETRGDHVIKGNFNVEGNGRFEKGLDSAYLEVIDQKQSGSPGGTFTGQEDVPGSAAWVTRDLTNVIQNDFATAIFSGTEDLEGPDPEPVAGDGGDITLERGVYYTEISAPAISVNEHVTRLADVTDNPGATGDTVILGTSEFAADASLWRDFEDRAMLIAAASQTRSVVTGRFTLTSQRVLEIQHRCAKTQPIDGLGSDGAFYETNNVFTIVKMWHIRDDT
jgi:hypothetical protein